MAGIMVGMPIIDAQALLPDLVVAHHNDDDDHQHLLQLAAWSQRFSPWTATDGRDGLAIDITGCAHLFGGEEKLIATVVSGLKGIGFEARAACADTLRTAWAVARHAGGTTVVPGGQHSDVLKGLPVAALDLDVDTIASLRRVGIRRVADLMVLQRASIARRFPKTVLCRLDEALGRRRDPRHAFNLEPRIRSWLKFAEPISATADVEACLAILVDKLCVKLSQMGRGTQSTSLVLCRVDGSVQHMEVGTASSTHDRDHLKRLFALRTERIDPGFGIELAILEAVASELVGASQTSIWDSGDPKAAAALPILFDRLSNRLGRRAVMHIDAHQSHVPELASSFRRSTNVNKQEPWPEWHARPLGILSPAQPLNVPVGVADGQPAEFTWRQTTHRIVRFEGPERIEPEWWHQGGPPRDYYRVEDDRGRRYWLYKQASADGNGRWFVHGFFG